VLFRSNKMRKESESKNKILDTDEESVDNERKPKRSRIEDFWDCIFCTYRNKSIALTCEACYIRKGTSTRKPRYSLVAQQYAKIENQIEQQLKKEKKKETLPKKRNNTSLSSNSFSSSLTDLSSESSGQSKTFAITDNNNLTIFITEYDDYNSLISHSKKLQACLSPVNSKLKVNNKAIRKEVGKYYTATNSANVDLNNTYSGEFLNIKFNHAQEITGGQPNYNNVKIV